MKLKIKFWKEKNFNDTHAAAKGLQRLCNLTDVCVPKPQLYKKFTFKVTSTVSATNDTNTYSQQIQTICV
jgi:hypothetical protein